MGRFRFSIAGLLAAVLASGLGFAALRDPTDLRDSALLGLTSLLLLASILLAVHRTGPLRAYWLGFALFGCTYLGLSLVPPIESRLPTTRSLAFLESKVVNRPASMMVGLTGPGGGATTTRIYATSSAGVSIDSSGQGPVRLWDLASGRLLAGTGGTSENFLRIGHSLYACLLAFLGGHLSRCLHDPGRPPGATSLGS